MEFLNEHTRYSLDMDYIWSLISPKTPYGTQRKREMKSFGIGEEALLERDYDETEGLMLLMKKHRKEFSEISRILGDIKEIRQSIKRATEGMILDEVELFEIKDFIFSVREILGVEENINEISRSLLVYRIYEIEELLDPEKKDARTFYIYDSYSEELSRIRVSKRVLQREIDGERKRLITLIEESLETKVKLSGEISLLKKDEDKYKRAQSSPYLVEGASTMLQATFKLKNSELMNELTLKLEDIKQKETSEEYRIKKRLSQRIGEIASDIYDLVDRVSRLDFFMARAEFAISIGGIRPILHCHDKIIIRNGVHPRLNSILSKKGKSFLPISFTAEGGVTVITGANMGGKTVSLKLAGMLTAMAQYGLFVPAERFETCLFDYIYFSIGDKQSIDSGLSTFGSEISGMIEILGYDSWRGLVLIDELARGTNPEEGYAISRAIVGHLQNINSITLFTTHFDGITSETGVKHLRVKGLKNIDFQKLKAKQGSGASGIDMVLESMDYSLEEVASSYEVPRDAINIARLMGLNEEIINYAEKVMNEGREDNNGKVKS